MNSDRLLDISWGTIFKISLAFLFFYIVYLVRDILVWFIFALIISVLFEPFISFLQRLRFPRLLSVVLVYVSLFVIFGILIYLIFPPLGFEIIGFSSDFSDYLRKASPFLTSIGLEAFESPDTLKEAIGGWIDEDFLDILKSATTIFGGIFSAVTIFVIAIFISLEEKGIEKILHLISPKRYESQILNIWEKSQKRVVGWFGVRILTSIFVGFAVFLGCKILFIDQYAVSFGILTGITNIIPIVGPVIAGIIMLIFVILLDPLKALFIIIIFILIQLIENNILTPILAKQFMGLPAVLVLVSLLIGGTLWGILGALLAIPLFGILFEFLRDFLKRKKDEKAVVM